MSERRTIKTIRINAALVILAIVTWSAGWLIIQWQCRTEATHARATR